MTPRQKILKFFYPLLLFYRKIATKPETICNERSTRPVASFYDLTAELNNGTKLYFSDLRGRKILLVNTASDCGYTAQYYELQQLQQKFPGKLDIIAFPSNDFKRQEKGSDKDIAEFCERYAISFPLTKKSSVLKGAEQNEVFKWLTTQGLNGWNEKQPSWNFSKYLVDEQGTLTHYFDPAVSPLEKGFIKAIRDGKTLYRVS